MRLRSILAASIAVLALGAGVTACGGSSGSGSSADAVNPNAPEASPPGDIPDNQVFVAYSPPGGGYSIKVPEGWSRSSSGGATTFTDKLNSIRLESMPAAKAPTVATAQKTLVPQLSQSVKGFVPGKVSTVHRSAGPALLITYGAAGKPDPVTGKSTPEAVERYIFFHKGKEVIVTLSGAKGADNVDPWRIVTNSLHWTQ